MKDGEQIIVVFIENIRGFQAGNQSSPDFTNLVIDLINAK